MDVFSGVCLSVCLFLCQHDNFRTIKHDDETWRLGAMYKNIVEFECQHQRSRSLWTKTALSAADIPGWVGMVGDRCKQREQQRIGPFRGCQGVFCSCVIRHFYAGGKISACCLVTICHLSVNSLLFIQPRWQTRTYFCNH